LKLKYLKERDHFEDLGIDGWIALKWILKWGAWTGFNGLRIETSDGLL
jgi:hypothetical protein